jgi:hypothetical protein
MIIALLILLIGLSPSILSLVVLRRGDRTQARLNYTVDTLTSPRSPRLRLPPDATYVEQFGYVIGDISCRFNARSPHVRCAVNPSGPCHDCVHYESVLPDKDPEP